MTSGKEKRCICYFQSGIIFCKHKRILFNLWSDSFFYLQQHSNEKNWHTKFIRSSFLIISQWQFLIVCCFFFVFERREKMKQQNLFFWPLHIPIFSMFLLLKKEFTVIILSVENNYVRDKERNWQKRSMLISICGISYCAADCVEILIDDLIW